MKLATVQKINLWENNKTPSYSSNYKAPTIKRQLTKANEELKKELPALY